MPLNTDLRGTIVEDWKTGDGLDGPVASSSRAFFRLLCFYSSLFQLDQDIFVALPLLCKVQNQLTDNSKAISLDMLS